MKFEMIQIMIYNQFWRKYFDKGFLFLSFAILDYRILIMIITYQLKLFLLVSISCLSNKVDFYDTFSVSSNSSI